MSAFTVVDREKNKIKTPEEQLTKMQQNMCMLFSKENSMVTQLCQILIGLKDSIAQMEYKVTKLQKGQAPVEAVFSQSSADELMKIASNEEFEFFLEMKGQLQPIYKDRKFKLNIILKDLTGQLTRELDSCMIELAVYSHDNPPRRIDLNHQGNSILKGKSTVVLRDGECIYQAMQIRDVSSHYRTGRVSLNVSIKCEQLAKRVKPLMIPVVVKAKKNKKQHHHKSHQQKIVQTPG